MALDWVKIKNEYISTRTSYRKLAEKYGTHKDTIAARAKAENWLSERDIQTDRIQTKARQKIVAAVATQEADRILTLLSISDKLARRIDQAASDEVDSQDILRLTSALKNVRDVALTVKTDEDAMRKLDKLLEGVSHAAQS